jgi:2-phosphoglycerate kinase
MTLFIFLLFKNLKQRIKESQARSWTICHGKRLVDGGREEKMQITPREVDDVVQRAVREECNVVFEQCHY